MIQVEKETFKDMVKNKIICEWNITSKEKKSKRKKYYVPLTSNVKKYLISKNIDLTEQK